jgi:protein-S-isoprenylcysteine O-methyltransferase Ste14
MSAPTTPRLPSAAPRAGRDPALPPPAAQWALRLFAAAVHMMFVSALMQDQWGAYWWDNQFHTFGPWLGAFADACFGSLRFFADGLFALAPWALVEALAVALVFGVRFQFLMRLCATAGLLYFAKSALAQYHADPSRITLLLLVITEIITVVLVMFARAPGRQDWSPSTAFFTTAATFYFLLLDFRPADRLIPEWAGVTLQAGGTAWTIIAKLSLGRSFGLLPADRGIVTRGAYRCMRHPVYFGYFINGLGFLLPSFGWRNGLVYGFFLTLQLMRILREERLLRTNPEYQAYCQKVRWRFVPGVF